MAVTLGNNSNSGKILNADTAFNWNHTCAANTTVLVVLVGASDPTVADMDVTGITYDGNALTWICGAADAASGCNSEIWYRLAPTTGAAKAVQVTFAGKVTNSDGTAVDLLGTDTVTPLQACNTATGSNSDPTVTVAGAVADTMTLAGMVITDPDPAALSVSVGTQITEIDLGNEISGTAYKADTGTITWAHTTDDQDWVMTGANFKPPRERTPRYGFILYQTPAIV